jgi:hypothetical protein
MAEWTSTELSSIDKTDELELQSLRRDGTLRDSVTMWVVRVGDDLYVRCMNGRDGGWFQGALSRHQARVRADGAVRDVVLVETEDSAVNDRVDAAYRAKYARYAQIAESMTSAKVRAATLKLAPQ